VIDLAQLKARAEAARRFDHAVGPASFSLVVPTRQELTVYAAQARAEVPGLAGADVASLMALAAHPMLCKAVRGWSGLLERHLLADGSEEPVPFDPGVMPLVIDAQPEWAAELVQEIYRRIGERKARIEAAAKN
jgi:hypothetical protein